MAAAAPAIKGSHKDHFLRRTSTAGKPRQPTHSVVCGDTGGADDFSWTTHGDAIPTRSQRDSSCLTSEPTAVEGRTAPLSPLGQLAQLNRLLLSLDTINEGTECTTLSPPTRTPRAMTRLATQLMTPRREQPLVRHCSVPLDGHLGKSATSPLRMHSAVPNKLRLEQTGRSFQADAKVCKRRHSFPSGASYANARLVEWVREERTRALSRALTPVASRVADNGTGKPQGGDLRKESMEMAPLAMVLGSNPSRRNTGRWSTSLFAFVFSVFITLLSLACDLSSDLAVRLARARRHDEDTVECVLKAAQKELYICREEFLRSKSALFHAEKRLARVQFRLNSP